MPRARSRSATRTASPPKSPRSSSRPSISMPALTSDDVRKIVEPYVREALGHAADRQGLQVVRQPDRRVRHRRSGWRRRPHRPQDHRRHLRWRGPAWRRRLLGQGPHQGRPLGGLCRALSRQEHRRGRPRRPRHDPAELRHRRRQAADRSMSISTAPAKSTRPSSRTRWARCSTSRPRGIRTHLAAQQADLRQDLGLRPFRPQARPRRQLLVGKDRPRPA